MKIALVYKNDPSLVVDRISEPWRLKDAYRNSSASQHLLQCIYEKQQHLLCHCNPTPALMFVRYARERYTLVNHPVSGQHSQNCPLYSDIKGSIEHGVGADTIKESETGFERFVYHLKSSEGQSSSRIFSGDTKGIMKTSATA
ncbi:DUF1173 family protein [Photobacterium sp. ZSDE20]|uniref:DUF1173 family protein n=1 Tax=Photobacterium pectinilyticum TaxID=2906793 RepID=A0ABT1N774_9GAMM|nr:DUF1173 family protein [Photobacterium sp. ZSDE20]MCQ1060608.1 DUF1173 family protein [Photobacterium sp. ZSDE20]MDD1827803.1 DUF1173 family protein [Photobacterium sp. ZSDE20]